MSSREYMRLALSLARRGYGRTSPNPMVGAVLVRGGKVIGRGWHHCAGEPHAEIEAIADAREAGTDCHGATLYVTLEPCSTFGRTPPCTTALIQAGVAQVVIGASDPNPEHQGRGFTILRKAGIQVEQSSMAQACTVLNESFNHWIIHREPFVTVKAAMTLDGKIATASGQSKWITGQVARARGMRLRLGNDGILVGVNTIIADDPSLGFRPPKPSVAPKKVRRFVLDTMARTPLNAKVICDEQAELTTIVVSECAPKNRLKELANRAEVMIAPLIKPGEQPAAASYRTDAFQFDLKWLLKKLGSVNLASLLVEGGGETNAAFLRARLVQRVAFFYAPRILGGRKARPAVGGKGAESLDEALHLKQLKWLKLGPDLLLTALVEMPNSSAEI